MRNLTVLILCTSIMAVVLWPAKVDAQFGDSIADSLEWLNTQQQSNGSFGDEVGATAMATFAFTSSNSENPAAFEWLEAQDFNTIGLDEVSLAITALIAAERDVADFADGNLLARYSELMRENPQDQHTDALCLGLIARYNLDVPLQDDTLSVLLERQQSDGGFGVRVDDASDVTTSSLCVHVLAAIDNTDALSASLSFLRNTQLEDDGWSIDPEETGSSDALGTAFAMLALIAADEPFSDWGNPERTLVLFADNETGAFTFTGDALSADATFTDIISTIVAIPVFQGVSLNSYAPTERVTETVTDADSDIPVLDANWKLVGDGFGIELDTADDFFVTVVDPFTDNELSGVEIINWTADYSFTGYIVESHLTAEMLLWMATQDPSVLENISVSALTLMSDEELALLPEDVQARAQNAE